jgi:hypothetical protein
MPARGTDRSQRRRRGLGGLLGAGGICDRGVGLMEMLRPVGSGLGTGGGRGSVVRPGGSRGRCWGRRRSVRGVLIVGVGVDVDVGE